MPRAKQGGAREGSPQKAYSNRSDLNKRGPQPITTAPGQAYGEAAAQKAAQQAVPMAGIQTPPVDPTVPSNLPPRPVDAPEPGSLKWLHPTDRPDEHITTGLYEPPSIGSPVTKLSDVLARAAASPVASSAVMALADAARRAGL